MNLENAYSGRIAIVDLDAGSCEEEELNDDLVQDYLGGAGINLALFNRYASRNPLILGTGPLTASFAPASSLGVVTAKSPLTGSIVHVPLMWLCAVEFKLTGFDFLVVLGESEKPVQIWAHDELIDVVDASKQWGKNVWEAVDLFREEHGDENVQAITIGKAGERGSKLAQFSESYWGSSDRFALGAVMGQKNLKGIVMRGMGSFEVAGGFFEKCMELKNEIMKEFNGKSGVAPLLSSLGMDGFAKAIKPMIHFNRAGFNSPYAANSFMMYNEDPKILAETGVTEPGCLITDILGLVAFKGLGADAVKMIEKIQKLGLEPTGTSLIMGKKSLDEALGEVEKLAEEGRDLTSLGLPNFYGVSPSPISSPEANLIQAVGIFSPAVPQMPLISSWGDFGVGDSPVEKAEWWIERQAISYITGICPLFSLISPKITSEEVAELLSLSLGMELSSFDLERLAKKVISETIEAGKKEGEVHPSFKSPGFEGNLKQLRTALQLY